MCVQDIRISRKLEPLSEQIAAANAGTYVKVDDNARHSILMVMRLPATVDGVGTPESTAYTLLSNGVPIGTVTNYSPVCKITEDDIGPAIKGRLTLVYLGRPAADGDPNIGITITKLIATLTSIESDRSA